MAAIYDRENPRKSSYISEVSEGAGKSKRLIVCAWCDTEFWAYIWSMAGGGKKCPGCGAMHSGGQSYKVIKKSNK